MATGSAPGGEHHDAGTGHAPGAATLNQVEQTKVVTEGGELLGTIAHLEIDDEARKVTAYALASSLRERVMRHEETFVKADQVMRLGEGGIMVVANAVATRLQAQPG